MSIDLQTLAREAVEYLDRQPKLAEQKCDALLASLPDNADAIAIKGVALTRQGKPSSGIKCIQRAIEINPGDHRYHHFLGDAYSHLGELEKSGQAFLQAIKLNKSYGEAYLAYSELTRFKDYPELAKQALTQLDNLSLDEASRLNLYFFLGKVHDDIGEYDRAFAYYKLGNEAAGRHYENREMSAFVDRTLATFNQEFCGAADISGNKLTPIFIVGLPRCGSTLVEQVITQSEAVFSSGEIGDIRNIAMMLGRYCKDSALRFPEAMPKVKQSAILLLRNSYFKTRLPAGGRFQFLLNKNLYNHLYVGLIFKLFPDAKIIHMLRDPLDCCLSQYFSNFTLANDQTFSLTGLKQYYLEYYRLMQHWQDCYANRIHHIHYADVVQNFEPTVKQLLDYCGLPWNEQMLEFHKSKNTVQTASRWQVRQPLYSRAIERWRHYEKHLGDLAELKAIGWNL